MIIYNALAKQPAAGRGLPNAQTAGSNQPAAGNTVVLKYNPLIETAQRTMTDLGLYKGPVDGVNGLRTQQAVQLYQQMNGMSADGVISDELVNQMKFAKQVQAAANFTGSTHEAVDPVAPRSPIISATPPVLVQKQAAAAPSQQPGVKKVQIALAGLGYQISKLDGQVNGETRAAILKYEMDNGLDMNGAVDKALMSALKIQAD
nr:peptidoglycan-binding domain-containing protein [Aestuariivirga litoralis]